MSDDGCPPPVPEEIIGCSESYADWIIIPYAALAVLHANEEITCQDFVNGVIDLETKYQGACGSSS